MAQQSEVLTEGVEGRAAPISEHDRQVLARNELRSQQSYSSRAWRRFRRNKIALVALGVCIFMLAFSFGAPIISSITGFDYYTTDLRNRLAPPLTDGHLLGTDANGRDLLTRLAYGGRISLTVAGLSAIFALVVGGIVGSSAGYFGGVIDTILMRFVDVIISIPGITILLLLSVLWRPGPVGLAVVIAALGWTGISRLVRGEVLSLRNRDYVDAARVSGASNSRIIYRHIIPNVMPIIIVWISLAIPGLILTEAALSYLGFGVRIPIPSWGNILEEAKEFYTQAWFFVFYPGLAIFLMSLAFNLVGNGLRDALDPRLGD